MSDTLISAIERYLDTALSGVNTSAPGTIVSYDAATNRAVVKPDLPKRISNDDVLDPPLIHNVPVVWGSSGGGAATLSFPIKPGDGVLLQFSQRSLEGWLSGNKSAPDDPRVFDLSDAIAVPGCAPSGIVGHSDDVVMKFNEAEVRIKPDKTIIVGNDKGKLVINSDGKMEFLGNANASITIDPAGNMTLKANTITVDSGGSSFQLQTHRHTGVQTGGGTSTGPV